MRALLPLLLSLAACPPVEPEGPAVPSFPAPEAWRDTVHGPGGSQASFGEADLFQPCTYLTGGPEDREHHNLAVMHDGYLVLPWAPEDGGGGVTTFDMTDPCAPAKVGEAFAEGMRESHTLAFGEVEGRTYLAVDYHRDLEDSVEGGVGFWDVTDPADPRWVAELALPGYVYPDAYLFVTLSTSWQGDVLYAAGGFNGVFLIDVRDPLHPALIGQHRFDPPMLVGSLHVIGDRALAAPAGGARAVWIDLSDPLSPAPLPAGDFPIRDREGHEVSSYFSNVAGRYALFARNHNGGGPIVYDLAYDAPSFVADHFTLLGDGGYVFGHEDRLFFGDSNFGTIYRWEEPTVIEEIAPLALQGDLDTVSPAGNVAIVSVDDDAAPGRSSAVVPWSREPDRRGPRLGMSRPPDGATLVAPTARVGLSFDEMIEGVSVHPGSLRVWDERGVAVPGRFNAQENLVNFTPDEPLEDDTTYFVLLPAGGIADGTGNALEEDVAFSFSTGGSVADPL
jgi:hypothetical protein